MLKGLFLGAGIFVFWGCSSGPDDSASASTGSSSSGGSGGGQVDAQGCPIFDIGATNGFVTDNQIYELSGIAASRKNADVLWIHNDAGDGARVFAISTKGETIGAYSFANTSAIDWEDIAIGPGPQNGESYIYAGDIGDNNETRGTIDVYRVAEPVVETGGAPIVATLDGVERFSLIYPDKPHNSESLFVDPLSGDVYVVVKANSGKSPVFRAIAPLSSSGSNKLALVTTLEFGVAPLAGNATTTGADILPDGSGIAIRTYDSAYFWWRKPGASVAAALQSAPCILPLRQEMHGEALGFAANGGGYYTASEGTFQPLYFYAWK